MIKVGNCKHGMPCVYAIINIATGKVYIGSTCRFSDRFREHRRLLNLNEHHSKKLQHSFNFHGTKQFQMRVVEYVCVPEMIYEREQFWIDRHGFKNTYNMAPMAQGTTRVPNSVYSIDPKTGHRSKYESAMSAAQDVLKCSGKRCQIRKAIYSLTKAGGLFWASDKHVTLPQLLEVKRRKRREKLKPKVFAFNVDRQLVTSFGTIAEAAACFNVCPSQIGAAMKTDRFRTAAGLLWSDTKTPPQATSKKTKSVIQKCDGKLVAVWDSLIDAAKAIDGVNLKGISSAATGYIKSHGGYQWEFVKT